MKKYILFLFILLNNPLNAQWVYQTGTGAYLNDVYSISEDIAVVVADDGLILKTTDGGANWIEKNSGTTTSLYRVQFVNSTVGFCIGHNGLLLKTMNGGEDWSVIASGQLSYISGISCIDENTIYLTDAFYLKKSTDGGQNFSVVNDSQDLVNIHFIDEMVGFAVSGDAVYKTTDGGITWNNLNTNLTPAFYNEYFTPVYFVNASVGYILDGNDIYKTNDGGANFNYVSSVYNVHVFNLYATLPDILWTAAIPTLDFSDCYTSRVETFADNTETGLINGGPCLKSIHFSNPTHGFAISWGGDIYKNTTGTMLGTDPILKKETVNIYPNPASDHVTITLAADIPKPSSIEIADIMGKKLYSNINQTENVLTLNTLSFSKGVYFVTVSNEGRRQTEKLIIK